MSEHYQIVLKKCAAFIIMSSLILKKTDKKRRWLTTDMFQNRIERDGTRLLGTMPNGENTGHIKKTLPAWFRPILSFYYV